MRKIQIQYNPYRLKALVRIDGAPPQADSKLSETLKDERRLQEWIGAFPKMLRDEYSTDEFAVSFFGMKTDWDDVQDAFRLAKEKGIIRTCTFDYIEAPSNEKMKERICKIMQELQASGIGDFQSERLIEQFNKIYTSSFPINVIATMSSGKSTLINALLGQELLPAANEATTATIVSILDNDCDVFKATVFDKDKNELKKVDDLSLKIMRELNGNSDIDFIAVEGNIPFLTADGIRLEIVDTPGPNNSCNPEHETKTYDAISNGANNLILYVLNGQQLEIKDDRNLLEYVASQIKSGGKVARDRFMFVINKMDSFQQHESVTGAIERVRKYLAECGIEDPQIFPCSALTGLEIRTVLQGVKTEDIANMVMSGKLDANIMSAFSHCTTMNNNPDLHLEQYSTLCPSAKKELEVLLKKAQEEDDYLTEALIHSGVLSIEATIRAYVKKYAITKMIRDLVETFEDVLESASSIAKLTDTIAKDRAKAEQFSRQADLLQSKINHGRLAEGYKQEIAAFTNVAALEREATDQAAQIMSSCYSQIYAKYDPYKIIESRYDAIHLAQAFTEQAQKQIPQLNAFIQQKIDVDAKNKCQSVLAKYRKLLDDIDLEAGSPDMSTFDLIKGKLSNMEKSFTKQFDTDYAIKQADLGMTRETIIKEIKVPDGIQIEERPTGIFESIVIGYEKKAVGTEKVKNPDKKWFQFWKSRTIEKTIYQDVPITERREIIERVEIPQFKTEEKIEYKTTYNVKRIIENVGKEVDDKMKHDISEILGSAKAGLNTLKEDFSQRLDEVNAYLIKLMSDLKELSQLAFDHQAVIEKNEKLLKWLTSIQEELNAILDLKEVYPHE